MTCSRPPAKPHPGRPPGAGPAGGTAAIGLDPLHPLELAEGLRHGEARSLCLLGQVLTGDPLAARVEQGVNDLFARAGEERARPRARRGRGRAVDVDHDVTSAYEQAAAGIVEGDVSA